MIKALSHIGISVANLERAVDFYQRAFGLELSCCEPFGGALYDAIMGLKDVRGRAAVLRGNGLELEVFEFFHPAPQRTAEQRPVCDHGITHFCLEVRDIEDEVTRLVSAGASFHCAPILFGDTRATYGRDPDGNVFELIEASATVATNAVTRR